MMWSYFLRSVKAWVSLVSCFHPTDMLIDTHKPHGTGCWGYCIKWPLVKLNYQTVSTWDQDYFSISEKVPIPVVFLPTLAEGTLSKCIQSPEIYQKAGYVSFLTVRHGRNVWQTTWGICMHNASVGLWYRAVAETTCLANQTHAHDTWVWFTDSPFLHLAMLEIEWRCSESNILQKYMC